MSSSEKLSDSFEISYQSVLGTMSWGRVLELRVNFFSESELSSYVSSLTFLGLLSFFSKRLNWGFK